MLLVGLAVIGLKVFRGDVGLLVVGLMVVGLVDSGIDVGFAVFGV
jgi:hypothetical protein